MKNPFKSLIPEIELRRPRIYINDDEKVKFNRNSIDCYLIDEYNSLFRKLTDLNDGIKRKSSKTFVTSNTVHVVSKLIKKIIQVK